MNTIISDLENILTNNPGTRNKLVFNLIEKINNLEEPSEFLLELSNDLEFYVENPVWRREDYKYYGDDKLEIIINNALLYLLDLLEKE